MTHEEKAREIVREWRDFWIKQEGYTKAYAIDANMRHHLEELITKALAQPTISDEEIRKSAIENKLVRSLPPYAQDCFVAGFKAALAKMKERKE